MERPVSCIKHDDFQFEVNPAPPIFTFFKRDKVMEVFANRFHSTMKTLFILSLLLPVFLCLVEDKTTTTYDDTFGVMQTHSTDLESVFKDTMKLVFGTVVVYRTVHTLNKIHRDN